MKKNITFIAEIGLNHNGNFGLIFELIKQAAAAGADFAKFQLGWRAGEGQLNNLGPDELTLIERSCEYHDIKPLFSIFTDEAWNMVCDRGYEAYKIASRTVVDNPRLVREILNAGKTTYISLGMTDESLPFGRGQNIRYLWCKSEYPALPWQLSGLPKDFSNTHYAGYSDHSVGIDVPLLAICRGAQVVEKHFTLDKSDVTIRDHALSATPKEFRELVQIGTAICKNLSLGL